MQLYVVLVATSRNQLFRIRPQWISVIMSMETFQNVDKWLISTDVSSMLTACWNEAEPVPSLDDGDDDTSYLSPACITDEFAGYDVVDCLNSPVQSISLFSLISVLFDATVCLPVTSCYCKLLSFESFWHYSVLMQII